MAVEGGGGGWGGGVIGDVRIKTSCRMISKEKISALKKNLMAYNAGKKLTPLYDGENS